MKLDSSKTTCGNTVYFYVYLNPIGLIYGSHISPFLCNIGHVDFFGNLTGDSIAFIYPDLKHVLLGTFTKGTVYILKQEAHAL